MPLAHPTSRHIHDVMVHGYAPVISLSSIFDCDVTRVLFVTCDRWTELAGA